VQTIELLPELRIRGLLSATWMSSYGQKQLGHQPSPPARRSAAALCAQVELDPVRLVMSSSDGAAIDMSLQPGTHSSAPDRHGGAQG
jgi:hypothetical protein